MKIDEPSALYNIKHHQARYARFKEAREVLESILKDPQEELDPVDEYKISVTVSALQEHEKESENRILWWETALLSQRKAA